MIKLHRHFACDQCGMRFLKVGTFYLIPYMITNLHLVLITYLQHTDVFSPHFRNKEWTWFRGALCTIDRSFGPVLDHTFHHITDTHVVHHLFPQIPHYNLVEATDAVKPVLGDYYREPKKSGWFPIHLFRNLTRSFSRDHYVEDTGDVVYYQPAFGPEAAKAA